MAELTERRGGLADLVSSSLAQAAWMPILRGVLSIIFGLAAFLLPGPTIGAIVVLFGIYFFIDGVLAIIASFRMATRRQPWLGLLFAGICGIAAGIITFRTPDITAFALLYVVAAWAFITGIAEIAAAVELREIVPGEWALGLAGILSVLLGCLLVYAPSEGLLAMIWTIGIYAVAYGGVLLTLGIRLRSLAFRN